MRYTELIYQRAKRDEAALGESWHLPQSSAWPDACASLPNAAKHSGADSKYYCTHGDGRAAYCWGWFQGWFWLVLQNLVLAEGGGDRMGVQLNMA
jgi:hypothetical protein